MSVAYYFGCWKNPGHYVFEPKMRQAPWQIFHENPWATAIDGALLQRAKIADVQGHAVFDQKDGWGIVSFWDNSVDSRGHSNSSFLIEGGESFEDVLTKAREIFPEIFQRIKFTIMNRNPHGDNNER